jgi:hypothetical protein
VDVDGLHRGRRAADSVATGSAEATGAIRSDWSPRRGGAPRRVLKRDQKWQNCRFSDSYPGHQLLGYCLGVQSAVSPTTVSPRISTSMLPIAVTSTRPI